MERNSSQTWKPTPNLVLLLSGPAHARARAQTHSKKLLSIANKHGKSTATVRPAGTEVMASVKRYPRAILSTPGTSGYRLSYKRVLRVVPHKPLRPGIF